MITATPGTSVSKCLGNPIKHHPGRISPSRLRGDVQTFTSSRLKYTRGGSSAAASLQVDENELSSALAELKQAQDGSSDAEVCDAKSTQVLVETAMFAAMGGLAFSVAAVLKLQGYMGYLLPMPIVLSALRSGPGVARKTAVATAFLLFVLMGPLQAVSYLLQHGCTAWALGTGWHFRFPWWLSVLSASIVRMLGTISFIAFTSWTLNENLYRLLVTQIHALLEQLTVMLKISGSPSPLTIQVFMGASLLVNCLMYIALLHVMYAIFLSSMGYKAVELPSFVRKRIMPYQ